ncbi:L-threonylcarbamoyladenylate synthase [Limnobacter humi]|uniref:L-threonylcarbamoyladenylate synthase n=1 Tax=Limnobacter humi TaxID=1778671 RepID=A0ABT1WI60_9BURK|nr:L-threonylcarbamoyladenylate synthase [Limnobacter humi]MCQ8897205.1 L-threonylcarbamoyladenylate synthase [Limnobacter humi]
MAQFFNVHPDNPQPRTCKQAADLINGGAIAAIPTDSCYALVCQLDDKNAVERLRRLKGISEKQHLALLCKDLSDLGSYAKVNNVQYRLLKSIYPGPYTFILEATREVPKRVSHPSKKSIGLRVPNHAVVQALLEHTNGPLIATTAQLPGMDEPCRSGWEVEEAMGHDLDLIVDDGEYCGALPTTVIDWTSDEPVVVRLGAGPLTGPLEPIEIDEQEAL